MRRAVTVSTVIAAAMLLAACFLLPGKFASTLDFRRDGGFDFAYRGEIVLVSVPGMGGRFVPAVDDPTRLCFGPAAGTPAPVPTPMPGAAQTKLAPSFAQHVCTPEERAKRSANIRQQNSDQVKRREQEGARLSQVIGMDPTNDASMRRYAAMVEKQAGWKSVVYRGNGVFDVDYAQSGRLDRDFVFPVLPRASVIVPFVVIRTRADGTSLVTAPGYRANPAQAALSAFGQADSVLPGSHDPNNAMPAGGPIGSFVVTTDLPPLTNNTDDGPATAGGRSRLTWTIAAGNDKVPEALIPRGH